MVFLIFLITLNFYLTTRKKKIWAISVQFIQFIFNLIRKLIKNKNN